MGVVFNLNGRYFLTIYSTPSSTFGRERRYRPRVATYTNSHCKMGGWYLLRNASTEVLMKYSVIVPLAAIMIANCMQTAVADHHSFPLTLEQGSRLTVAAKINGHPVRALLDSAAETTIIDREWAKQLQLAQGTAVSGQGSGNASFAAQLVNGVTLETLGLRLAGQTVAIADLSDMGHRLLHHRVDVILGREIFDAARLFIDIEGGRISAIGRTQEPRGIRLDLISEHGVETVPVRVESSEPARATFDLGNGSHVLIGAAFAKRMGLLSDGREINSERGGGLGGETERQVFRLRTLEIAGVTFTNVEAAMDNNNSASDVNVGVSVLRHFIITTDFHQHAMWLDPRN
jgi:predicted aspartyl protease